MRRLATLVASLLALAALSPSAALAIVHAGDVAPNFTKTELGGGPRSLSDYSPGKVVVLFLLGST